MLVITPAMCEINNPTAGPLRTGLNILLCRLYSRQGRGRDGTFGWEGEERERDRAQRDRWKDRRTGTGRRKVWREK